MIRNLLFGFKKWSNNLTKWQIRQMRMFCFSSKISILVLLIFVINFSNCSTIDVAVAQNKDLVKSMKNIAIVPFEFKTNPPVGPEFSNSLAIYFIKNGRIQIIERNKDELEKVFGELKLSRSGLIDENTASDMGKILGVDVIMVGYGETLEVDGKVIINKFRLKVINVQTGTLILGVIKDPGIEWTPGLIAKYILGFGLIWDKKDMLVQSSSIRHLSEATVKSVLDSISEIEKNK